MAVALLLGAVTYSTVILRENRWIAKIHLVKFWYAATWSVIAYLVAIYLNEMAETPFLPPEHDGRILWTLPPAWVMPGFLEKGGIVPAAVWIFLGALSWVRWPSTTHPWYDKPYDFFGAFGSFAREETHSPRPPETPAAEIERQPEPAVEKGWVDRLIYRSFSSAEKPVAMALLDPGKYRTFTTNLVLVLAPLWLLGAWAGRDLIPAGDSGASLRTVFWIIPAITMLLTIFPHSNGIRRATDPYPFGGGHIPFFCTLPVSIRDLLRVSQKLTLVRGAIFCLIATPFFYLLAIIDGMPEVAAGLLGAIPVFTAVWVLSRPVLVWHRIQAAMKRKRGILLLHYASGGVEVILFFLWALSGCCGVAAAYFWAAETTEFLLLPASVCGIILSGVFSRIILEIAINEMRHRRYDWIATPKA